MIKWGMIGLGNIANDFAKVIIKENGIIDGIATRKYEKAKDFAKDYNVKTIFESPIELIKSKEIDIIYISTPNNTHFEYIKEALLNGKHVLCEKAITLNIEELEEVYKIADEKELILAEAMTIFNMPLYRYIKENYIEKLGSLKIQQISFGSKKPYDKENRFFNFKLGGGAMLDIGTYAISMARVFLSSEPTEILSIVNKAETGVDDISTIILKNKENELTTINLSFTAKMPKRAVIGFENGYIEVEDYPRADTAKIVYSDGSSEIVTYGASNEALNYEFKMMNEAIINKNKKITSIEMTKDVIKIMTNILKKN
ncbi:Gfo/Idh/MocA family oxidoreductase [uncultured Clostridium sp.]|uniref:Gfo/Idh/MocA family protein n=1 Tax=uncultured Clostridium sp. TaxID=59620 RepID=UPI002607DC98|nr:Gfo/Idh/MocA family oxidoreductase [uncultured Clostridium sp.]